MEKVINSILSKRGFSLVRLAKELGVNLWTLQHAKKGSNYLKYYQIKKLERLYSLPSLKLMPKKKIIVIINKKRYIDTYNILPSKERNGLDIYCKIVKNRLNVWYQPKNRKSIEISLPKHIRLDDDFITCLGLSIGDGLNYPSKTNIHYNFANTNLELVKNIYHWLTHYFKLKKHQIHIYAYAPTYSNIRMQKELVSNLFGLHKEKIRIYKYNRNKKLSVMLQVGNSIFQCLYLRLFKKLNWNILNDTPSRRAFLRGLFAAEGHIKHSIYGTVESIGFAFNPKTEADLALFIKRCLSKEGIVSKINGRGYLYFCNYNQMLKFYLIGLTDLNIEKRDKFIRLCKNVKIQIYLKGNHIFDFNKFSQYKLAKKWGLSQSAFSNYKVKNRVSFDIAKKVLSKRDLVNKVDHIKVASNPIYDPDLIRFLIRLL